MPIIPTSCTFGPNTATELNGGNDIYLFVSSLGTYASIFDTCSHSNLPTLMTSSGDLSEYLPQCVSSEFIYVTSSGKSGSDVGKCSAINSPCRTIGYVLSEYSDSPELSIRIIESEYTINSTNIGDFFIYLIPNTVGDVVDTVSVGFDTLSILGNALFIIVKGYISFTNLNLIHNGSNRGIFISITDAEGSTELKSCLIFGSILSTSISTTQYSFILSSGSGNGDGKIILEDSIFSNINISGKSVIEADGSTSISISHSKFEYILSTGNYNPAITISVLQCTVKIVDCVFNKLISSSSSVNAGVFYANMDISYSHLISGNTISNITSTKSSIYMMGDCSKLLFSNNSLYNIESSSEGGVCILLLYFFN
jgi:hypothetical protein